MEKLGTLQGLPWLWYLLHMGYIGHTATVLSQGYPHFPSDYGHFTKCSTFICSKQMQRLGQINLQLSGFDCKGDWHRYSIYWFTKQEPRSTNLKEMLQTNFFCSYCFLLRSLKWPNSYSFFSKWDMCTNEVILLIKESPAPVEVGSLSHDLPGIENHLRWYKISSINSSRNLPSWKDVEMRGSPWAPKINFHHLRPGFLP